MNSIPSSAAVAITPESPICPICFDDLYQPEDRQFAGWHLAIVKPCEHKFHFNCLVPWAKEHMGCPVGRRSISDIVRLPLDWQHQMVNAAKEGDTETIRALLNQKADANAGQAPGSTPLALAATHKHLDAALLLASRGAADPIGHSKLITLLLFDGSSFHVDLDTTRICFLRTASIENTRTMNNLFDREYGKT